ncbi:MAG: hypothetical protein JWQ23_3040 [Herminiimonas sp.]|nr:hypothetical protein [Herminiimonas sp.]
MPLPSSCSERKPGRLPATPDFEVISMFFFFSKRFGWVRSLMVSVLVTLLLLWLFDVI